MRVLVLAAHPDDEVLGVGGTIAKYSSKGHDVFVAIMTDGSSSQYIGNNELLNKKKKEALIANEILGTKEVVFVDLPDMKLDTVEHVKINKEIERIIKKFKPEIVFTHHKGDVNKDHKLIYESTLVAIRPTINCCVREVYCYETASSTEWGSPTSDKIFIPNTYINISKFLDKKIEALRAYSTELRKYPHPRSIEAVITYSSMRGISIGMEKAEAFQLIRRLVK